VRRFVQSIVVVAATLVILIVAWQLHEALILFVLSLALAATVRGPATFWVNRGASRGLGIALTYVLGLIILVALVVVISGPVLRDLQQATDLFDRVYRQITTNWPAGTPFQQMISKQLPPPQDLYSAIAGEQGTQLLLSALGVASGFLGNVANLAIVLMLCLYWSLDRQHFERQWIALLPADKRRRAREIWRELEDGVGGYIRSELFQSVMAGLLLGFGYYVMGLRFPALIALIGALLWLIPWLGAGLAVVLPLTAGLYAGTTLAIAAPVYTIAVLAFLEMVVQPRMFDRRNYSSLLIVIVLVAMAEVYGLLGLLLAPPLAAAIQTLYTSLRRPTPPIAEQDLAIKVNALQQRVVNLREQVTGTAEETSPVVVSLLGRLSNLLEQADQLFESGGKPETRLETPVSQDITS
jgi:putative permease